ncbi:MAG TPA: hypothetical protein PLW88_05260, partial [Syntrophorhabdaceae bacterium]|nr:hypothetical protein [Syntrophorhabdaceae bacterium]
NGLSVRTPRVDDGKQEKTVVEEKKNDLKEMQTAENKETKVNLKNEENEIEPMFFITIPIVCHMIKNKVLEQDVLIPSSNNTWKKPMQIIKDKDRIGIKNISKLIGKGPIIRFLKHEDIKFRDGLDTEALLAGTGYTLDKNRLIDTFNNHVDENWHELFPYVVDRLAVVKTEKGFKFMEAKKLDLLDKKDTNRDAQWIMPDLKNLPIRIAIEQLNTKTGRIKVFGSGFVIDQSPKPNEAVLGDGDCIIYGRMSN